MTPITRLYITSFRDQSRPLRLAANGFVVALAIGIGWLITAHFVDLYPAYHGVVVEKHVDGWSMFTSGHTTYVIVVRDSEGRQSTHYINEWRIRVGDSVVKAKGFLHPPQLTAVAR